MISILLATLHGVALLGLFLLGIHRSHLLWTFERNRHTFQPPVPLPPTTDILIQIPIYNEANVILDCLCSVGELKWDYGQIQIQVLDDSTDHTSSLVTDFIADYKGGHVFVHRQRTERVGYKAGALSQGLAETTEPFIAVFDADFQPHASFLHELMPHFSKKSDIGMVQARWSHLNRNENALTQASAIVLDGHFVIEHSGRFLQDCFFNFNGTAGIWRRQCIVEAGGWQWSTITEDLDLSYRAQLKGWKFTYTPIVSADAEIPSTMSGLVAQQFRWAKGTSQVAKKILPSLWTSRESFKRKREGTVHLLANLGYWMTLLLSIVLPFTSYLRWNLHGLWGLLDLGVFLSSFVALLIFHQRSQVFLDRWNFWSWTHWRSVIGALIIGVGLAPSQSVALIEGFLGTDVTFERTPKSGASNHTRYTVNPSLRRHRIAQATVLLGVYSLGGLAWSIVQHNWASIPFQFIFSVGYLWVGLDVLRDSA